MKPKIMLDEALALVTDMEPADKQHPLVRLNVLLRLLTTDVHRMQQLAHRAASGELVRLSASQSLTINYHLHMAVILLAMGVIVEPKNEALALPEDELKEDRKALLGSVQDVWVQQFSSMLERVLDRIVLLPQERLTPDEYKQFMEGADQGEFTSHPVFLILRSLDLITHDQFIRAVRLRTQDEVNDEAHKLLEQLDALYENAAASGPHLH